MLPVGRPAKRMAMTGTSRRYMRQFQDVRMRGYLSRSGLHDVDDPIPHGVNGDRHVIDLAMVLTAFLSAEDPQGLIVRAHGIEAFAGQRQRDVLVVGTVQHEEGAAHLL